MSWRGQHRLVCLPSDGFIRVAPRVEDSSDPRLPRLPQAFRLFGECLPEVSVIAKFTPVLAHIDLNARQAVGGSSSRGMRERAGEVSGDMLSSARNMFDRMPAATNDERANHFIHSIIFEGAPTVAGGAGYDLNETQSQDGPGGPLMSSAYDQASMQPALVQAEVSLDLDGFPLNHVSPDDYGLD
ncbi:DNA repair protein rhp54 [Hordeum vulgare]|nr:DNA repair protein rhp54 [Hordeum vulgare]